MLVIGDSVICTLLSFTCNLVTWFDVLASSQQSDISLYMTSTSLHALSVVFRFSIFSSEISASFLFPFTRLSSRALDFTLELIFLSFFSLYVHSIASHQPTWLNVLYFTFQAFIYLWTRHFWRHYFTDITRSTALTFRTFTKLHLWFSFFLLLLLIHKSWFEGFNGSGRNDIINRAFTRSVLRMKLNISTKWRAEHAVRSWTDCSNDSHSSNKDPLSVDSLMVTVFLNRDTISSR